MDAKLAFQQALTAHHAGRLGDAERLYQQALQAAPGHFDSLFHLSLIAYQQGNAPLGLQRVERALRAQANAPAYALRGVLLMALGRHDEAIAGFDQALALDPAVADLHSNRGLALYTCGRHHEAIASFD